MAEPNYRPRPSTDMTNVIRSANSQRSATRDSYRGTTGSHLDNDLFELKQRKTRAIPVFENMAEHEIAMSKDKRHFFSPKQFQTIIANFDLSNLNADYVPEAQHYEFSTNNSRYYGNTFGRVGLEKVFKFESGIVSMPRLANFDQSRLFVQIDTTDFNIANYLYNYMFSCYPDTALSTASRISYKADHSIFQMNGYCALNLIKLQLRDIAGPVILPEPKMLFMVNSVGVTTTFVHFSHGLSTGMVVYVNPKSNRKNVFPSSYTITVLNPDVIEIPVNTTGLDYLVTNNIEMIIDDYVFNYNLKIYSIREDDSH